MVIVKTLSVKGACILTYQWLSQFSLASTKSLYLSGITNMRVIFRIVSDHSISIHVRSGFKT
jgi:hypothetical protein